MRILQKLMRVGFHLLYHEFAFAYDWVAAAVSLGRWTNWIRTVIPFIEGSPVLEIGSGPGHLQSDLKKLDFQSHGLDESRQMIKLARKRLKANGARISNLTRGRAARLPYRNNAFRTILSTFPSEYIFDPATLKEIHRVLASDGRFIILPAAWHVGHGLLERTLAWVFHVTGETPGPFEIITNRIKTIVGYSGFKVDSHKIETQASLLLVLVASKL